METKDKNKTERRKHPRIEVRWPVVLTMGEKKIKGMTMNVSIDGVAFYCEKPLGLSENYHMSIHPPGYHNIEVVGSIIWSDLYGMNRDKTYCMGQCLMEISEEDKYFIEDLIQDHLS